jgi:hypothetical protein
VGHVYLGRCPRLEYNGLSARKGGCFQIVSQFVFKGRRLKDLVRVSFASTGELHHDVVPVFSRCEHPKLGVGFNYEYMRNLEEVQLPLTIGNFEKPKKRKPEKFYQ